MLVFKGRILCCTIIVLCAEKSMPIWPFRGKQRERETHTVQKSHYPISLFAFGIFSWHAMYGIMFFFSVCVYLHATIFVHSFFLLLLSSTMMTTTTTTTTTILCGTFENVCTILCPANDFGFSPEILHKTQLHIVSSEGKKKTKRYDTIWNKTKTQTRTNSRAKMCSYHSQQTAASEPQAFSHFDLKDTTKETRLHWNELWSKMNQTTNRETRTQSAKVFINKERKRKWKRRKNGGTFYTHTAFFSSFFFQKGEKQFGIWKIGVK